MQITWNFYLVTTRLSAITRPQPRLLVLHHKDFLDLCDMLKLTTLKPPLRYKCFWQIKLSKSPVNQSKFAPWMIDHNIPRLNVPVHNSMRM